LFVRLFRPVGSIELELIEQSAWRRFPPRLPEQPIFYPVLNFDYAEQIARDWNSRHEPSRVGHVLEFDVAQEIAGRYPAKTAGSAALHVELWIPAEELEAFNDAIVGQIRLIATYRNGERVEAS
jgi:hypothetical protein